MVSSKVSLYYSHVVRHQSLLFQLKSYSNSEALKKKGQGDKKTENHFYKNYRAKNLRSKVERELWTPRITTGNHRKRSAKKWGSLFRNCKTKRRHSLITYERRINAFVSDRWVMMNPFTFVGQMSLRGSWM